MDGCLCPPAWSSWPRSKHTGGKRWVHGYWISVIETMVMVVMMHIREECHTVML